jgi:hypothetical protein
MSFHIFMIRNTFFFIFFINIFFVFSQEIDSKNPLYVVEDSSKYTYQMIIDDLSFLRKTFKQQLHKEKSGISEFGLEIPVVRLGSKKKKDRSILMVGNIHAREDFSSKFVMKFLNVLLLNINYQDTIYQHILTYLDTFDIYFIPVANPDGLKIAHLDFEGIEESFSMYKDCISLIETFEEWKANGLGIDLNASFDDGLHIIKKAPNFMENYASEGFKGFFPAEAIETKFLQEIIDELKPIVTLSFHTKGNIIFWADQRTHIDFKGIDTKINDEVIMYSCFEKASVSSNPIFYASGLENYIRAKHLRIASCVELSPGDPNRKQYPDEKFNELVWNKAWEIPSTYIRLASKYTSEIEGLKP